MKFKSAVDMLKQIQVCDLYCAELSLYVFQYTDRGRFGAIAYYHIEEEEAKQLAEYCSDGENYWAAFLGPGGFICDDIEDDTFPPNPGQSNVDFCERVYEFDWINTRDFKTEF